MKKITFISPPSISKTDFSAKQSIIPPEGLCLLAACTRDAGYQTTIIDADASEFSIQDISQEIKEIKPDFIGITSTTVTIHTCSALAKKIKQVRPEATIIIGGPHMTVAGKETMNFFKGDFDIAVYGEAEETIVELLESLVKNKPLDKIDGLMFFEKDKLIITKPRAVVKDLDKLPIPAWDLLPDIKKFYQQSVARAERFPSMSLMTSRGCPGQCIFCASENRLRAYSSKKLIKIVKKLIQDYKIKSLEINDDNFVVFKQRLRDFCHILLNEKIDLTWSCFARVNHVDKETLELMATAGCKRIAYGIESGNQEILNFERKGVTLEQIRKAVKLTSQAGIKVTGYFIIGHPLETKKTMQQTIDFAKELPLNDFLVSYMVPYPGTKLYEIADKYGKFNKDWKKMYQWDITFISNGLTKEDLEFYFKKGFREFYLRPRIIYNYAKRFINPLYTWKFLNTGFRAIRFVVLGK